MAENINQNTGKGLHILYAAVFEVLGLEEGEMAGSRPVFYLFGKSTLPSSQGESLLSTSSLLPKVGHYTFFGEAQCKTTPVN